VKTSLFAQARRSPRLLVLALVSVPMMGCGGGDIPLAEVPSTSELPKLPDGPSKLRIQKNQVSQDVPK